MTLNVSVDSATRKNESSYSDGKYRCTKVRHLLEWRQIRYRRGRIMFILYRQSDRHKWRHEHQTWERRTRQTTRGIICQSQPRTKFSTHTCRSTVITRNMWFSSAHETHLTHRRLGQMHQSSSLGARDLRNNLQRGPPMRPM